ncbi:V-type ATP synthase subunit E [uncultured Draconibacterium sp.]|uniref:V-type ATP synthase subunit E n=1 Tax=uncultured Draconibacterium sp. TaxID=1573823 RepID=UPI0032167777
MTDKIQEITEKIYNEGVIKAQADADRIISDARAKADEIIHLAQKTHDDIIAEAQKQADELARKTETEIQIAARQFISSLKQKVTEIITTAQIATPVKGAMSDVDFVKKIIATTLNNWHNESTADLSLKVLLPEKEEKEFSSFFDSKINEILNKGVDVSFDPRLERGFKIGPQDGSYILSFTDNDFENYFKSYFKDRTKRLLFESVEQE